MEKKLRKYSPELLSAIFLSLFIIGCLLLWSITFPSDFKGKPPIIFGIYDWLVVILIGIFIFLSNYFSYIKKKNIVSGLIMILAGSLTFFFAIFKMKYLEELSHKLLYSHYTQYDISFCDNNVRFWYYLIFISFTGLILTGFWKIILSYTAESRKAKMGIISLILGLVALFFSFLPSFIYAVDIWFLSHYSFSYWYMFFALVLSIIAIKSGGRVCREYNSGFYGITAGVLSIVISFFMSFYLYVYGPLTY